MLNLPQVKWALLVLVLVASASAKEPWLDEFYQYRIPVEVDAAEAGWNVVTLTPAAICEAIGKLEPFSFDPTFLAYNHVTITQNGKLLDGGFHLIASQQKLTEDLSSSVGTKKGGYYLVDFVSEGGKFPPTIAYEQTFPVGEPPRTHAYMSSYVPRVLPKKRTRHECLLRSDGGDLRLKVDADTVVDGDISVREATIELLVDLPAAGKQQVTVYYQPLGALYLKIPKQRRASVPNRRANVNRIGVAKKHLGDTVYRLPSSKSLELWFAETTVKLTRQLPAPSLQRERIRIESAANESQSFQIFLRPTGSDVEIREVRVTKLQRTSSNEVNEEGKIPSNRIDVRRIEYIPVKHRARINQVEFFGDIGDALTTVQPQRVRQTDGNFGMFFTVRTPAGTMPGKYVGTITIVEDPDVLTEIPLELIVHDFELPKFSTFHTHMGGQYFAKNSGDPKMNPIAAYHGVKTKQELKKLTKSYYEVMARDKFYPKNVALFVEVGMKWKPPPQGADVDAPGNFFELYDWDFTEFNETLEHFIDKLKVNSVCLTHTNPSVSHVFKHLPGEPIEQWNKDPGHATMGWQTFRRMTQATYNKQPHDPWQKTSLQVTRKQWDRLVLDYYRAMSGNLQKHGWLDKFYIFIDETSGTDKIYHLVKLLKSDPLTAKIRIAHCLQGFECLWHREGGEYAFNRWLTYVPQIDENYYRWEDYFWDDYEIPRDRDRLWSYSAYTSRLGINVPGLTNRQVGLEVFHLGGSGYVVWDTFMWHHPYGKKDDPRNPWQEPHARLANGALSYFYPPKRAGLSDDVDYTIIPSLRIMTYRESIDDYEYARILEDLVAKGKRNSVNVENAEKVLADVSRLFPSTTEWVLNDAWYLQLRHRMADAIVDLKRRLEGRP